MSVTGKTGTTDSSRCWTCEGDGWNSLSYHGATGEDSHGNPKQTCPSCGATWVFYISGWKKVKEVSDECDNRQDRND